MIPLPFLSAERAHTNYQYLEDLSTGYWFSEVLFAAIELKIFDLIEENYYNPWIFTLDREPTKEEMKDLLQFFPKTAQHFE